MTAVVHPFADEWTHEYAIFVASSRRVALSAPLRHFLADCVAERRRPVLCTGADARITGHLADALRGAGGFWALRTDAGVFDALTGRRVWAFPELWTDDSVDRERRAGHDAGSQDAVGAFFFDVFARDRAAEQTTIGPLVDHMVTGLGGFGVDRWGQEEPLAAPWDHAAVTESIRGQMPASEPILLGGPDRAFGSITVARTRTGLLEHARGAVPNGPYGTPRGLPADAPLATHPALAATLTGLAERFRPNVAMVSYVELVDVGAGLGQAPVARRRDLPVAALIGPRAVRDLRVDPADLATRHDVRAVGMQRAPSLLLLLAGRDDVWAQLSAFVHDLDEERLAAALAVEMREVP